MSKSWLLYGPTILFSMYCDKHTKYILFKPNTAKRQQASTTTKNHWPKSCTHASQQPQKPPFLTMFPPAQFSAVTAAHLTVWHVFGWQTIAYAHANAREASTIRNIFCYVVWPCSVSLRKLWSFSEISLLLDSHNIYTISRRAAWMLNDLGGKHSLLYLWRQQKGSISVLICVVYRKPHPSWKQERISHDFTFSWQNSAYVKTDLIKKCPSSFLTDFWKRRV